MTTKLITRIFSILLVIVFIIITCYAAILISSLPTTILEAAGYADTEDFEAGRQAAIPVFWVLGVELLLVLLMIFFFATGGRNSEQVIYVEKYTTNTNTQVGSQKENEQHIVKVYSTAGIEDVIQSIENDKENVDYYNKILYFIAKNLDASIGALYLSKSQNGKKHIEFLTGYAFFLPESKKLIFELGEGIAGQVAKSGKAISISAIPEGYIEIVSGLGKSTPKYMIVVPIQQKSLEEENPNEILGVIELGSFSPFAETELEFLLKVSNLLAKALLKTVAA